MTPEQAAAYVQAQAAEALIKALAMLVEDLRTLQIGNSSVHTQEAYEALIREHCIHHNAVLDLFQRVGG